MTLEVQRFSGQFVNRLSKLPGSVVFCETVIVQADDDLPGGGEAEVQFQKYGSYPANPSRDSHE